MNASAGSSDREAIVDAIRATRAEWETAHPGSIPTDNRVADRILAAGFTRANTTAAPSMALAAATITSLTAERDALEAALKGMAVELRAEQARADRVWLILCDTTDRGMSGERTDIEGAYRTEAEAKQEAARLREHAIRIRRPGGTTYAYRVQEVKVNPIELTEPPTP